MTRAEELYGDIINLPCPISKTHTQMSIENRASQFAPFSALTGYEEILKETGRLTDNEIILSNDKLEELDRTIALIQQNILSYPLVELTYFIQDAKKQGGKYVTTKKNVKRIDSIENKIIFVDKSFVNISNITDLCLIENKNS